MKSITNIDDDYDDVVVVEYSHKQLTLLRPHLPTLGTDRSSLKLSQDLDCQDELRDEYRET